MKVLKVLLPAAVAAMWSSDPVSAQEGESAAGLSEVVVTARRREENVQDVPVSVTALSGESLEQRGVRDISDIAKFAPNLTFDAGAGRGGGGSTSAVFIRGVGQTDFFGMSDPGVGMYVDEVYFGRSTGAVLDALDLERVEVLRGPQGTLFGRNTIGGAINISSRMPGEELEGFVQADIGSYHERNLKGALSVPFSDTVRARLSASSRTRDGTTPSLSVQDLRFDDINDTAARAVLQWLPHDGFVATLITDTSRVRRTGQAFRLTGVNPNGALLQLFNTFVPANVSYRGYDGALTHFAPITDAYIPDKRATYSNQTLFGAAKNNLDSFGTSVSLQWRLSDTLDLKLISAYRQVDFDAINDNDGTPFDYQVSNFASAQHQFSQEARVTGEFGHLTFVGGLYYFSEKIAELGRFRILNQLYQQTGNRALDISYEAPASHDTQSMAAYLDGTYALTERLGVSVGGRFSHDRKKVFHSNTNVDSGTVNLPVGPAIEPSWDSFTPRLSLQYRVAPDVLTYASVAEGFKAGGVNASAAARPTDFAAFDPEKQTTYEVGVKSEWLERRVRLNAAVFRSDYTKLQQRATLQFGQLGCTAVCTQVVNAAEARLEGVETELLTRPVRGLELFAGVGYLHQKFVYIDPVLLSSKALAFDRSIPKSPEWSFDVGAQLEHLLTDRLMLRTRLDYSYRSKQFQSIENDPFTTQPAFGLLGARIALGSVDGTWEATLSGDNLTDESYIVAANPSYLTGVGISSAAFGAPRTYTFSLRYNFSP